MALNYIPQTNSRAYWLFSRSFKQNTHSSGFIRYKTLRFRSCISRPIKHSCFCFGEMCFAPPPSNVTGGVQNTPLCGHYVTTWPFRNSKKRPNCYLAILLLTYQDILEVVSTTFRSYITFLFSRSLCSQDDTGTLLDLHGKTHS